MTTRPVYTHEARRRRTHDNTCSSPSSATQHSSNAYTHFIQRYPRYTVPTLPATPNTTNSHPDPELRLLRRFFRQNNSANLTAVHTAISRSARHGRSPPRERRSVDGIRHPGYLGQTRALFWFSHRGRPIRVPCLPLRWLPRREEGAGASSRCCCCCCCRWCGEHHHRTCRGGDSPALFGSCHQWRRVRHLREPPVGFTWGQQGRLVSGVRSILLNAFRVAWPD